MDLQRIVEIANECEAIASEIEAEKFAIAIERLQEGVRIVGRASTNSWLGYQAHIYYRGYQPPRPGDHFSSEWGFQRAFSNNTSDNWVEVSYEDVDQAVKEIADHPDISELESRSNDVEKIFPRYQSELVALLSVALEATQSENMEELRNKAKALKASHTASEFAQVEMPQGRLMSRDSLAVSQGLQPPHHVAIACEIAAVRAPFIQIGELGNVAQAASNYLRQKFAQASTGLLADGTVFIGHGRSSDWKELSSFIGDRLKLYWDEFNRESPAGLSIKERLENMLGQANFAFLIMTAEDEHVDCSVHARENVIHEIGLFQGRLGFNRAIILLEEGCDEFSNVHGIGQIRYPKGYISAAYEEIRRVLEREGLLTQNG